MEVGDRIRARLQVREALGARARRNRWATIQHFNPRLRSPLTTMKEGVEATDWLAARRAAEQRIQSRDSIWHSTFSQFDRGWLPGQERIY